MRVTVSTTIEHSHPGVTFAAPRGGRQPILARDAGLVAVLDSLAATASIVVVLISLNHAMVPGGLDDFLSARVTVKNVLLLMFLATAWPAIFHVFGLYENRWVQQPAAEASRLIAAVTAGSGLAFVFPLTSLTGSVTVWAIPRFWVTALALSLLIRIGRRSAGLRHEPRAVIVGTGRLALRAYSDLRHESPHRYHVVGFVDDTTSDPTSYDRLPDPVIGTIGQLEQILMRQPIDEVIIALPVKSCYEQIQHAIRICERAGVQAKYGADIFESTVASLRYDARGDRAFVAMQVAPDGYRLVIKRLIDIVGAVAGLILLAPLMLLSAIAIKLTSQGPVFYAQDRCGFTKRPFRMFKFRSMCIDAERLQASLETMNEVSGPVFKIHNDPRITPVGQLLRRTSLDELPQLWNVLRGEMSLVGPRPLPWRDVERITRPSDMRRFSMRPGLTCLWQVGGRNHVDFERWVELDLEYIDRWSLALDALILVKTIPAVLTGNGAN